MTTEKNILPRNSLATLLRSYVAVVGIALSSFTPRYATANEYVPLPEPRYTQEGVEYKFVGGKGFTIPKVRDQWGELRATRTKELKEIIEDTDSCSKVEFSGSGFVCKGDKCTQWSEPSVNNPHNLFNERSGESGLSQISETKRCLSSIPDGVTYFSVRYADLFDIQSSKHLLIFGDKISFHDHDGEEYHIFVADSNSAARGAQLLKELQSISYTIQQDHRDYVLEKDYKKAYQEYQAANLTEDDYVKAVNCIMDVRTHNYPLKLDAWEKKRLNILNVLARLEINNCVTVAEKNIRIKYQSIQANINSEEIKSELRRRLDEQVNKASRIKQAQQYLK